MKHKSPIITISMMRHAVPIKDMGDNSVIQQSKGEELWLLYKGKDLYKPNRPLGS